MRGYRLQGRNAIRDNQGEKFAEQCAAKLDFHRDTELLTSTLPRWLIWESHKRRFAVYAIGLIWLIVACGSPQCLGLHQ
jgi:hypothetical protein